MSKGTKGLKETNSEVEEDIEQSLDSRIKDTKHKLHALKVHHLLHFIISLLTAGVWIVGWTLIVIDSNTKKTALTKKLKKLHKLKEHEEEALEHTETPDSTHS